MNLQIWAHSEEGSKKANGAITVAVCVDKNG